MAYNNKVKSWIHMNYTYEFQCNQQDIAHLLSCNPNYIAVSIPVTKIIDILTKQEIIALGKMHDVWVPTKYAAQECRKLSKSINVIAVCKYYPSLLT